MKLLHLVAALACSVVLTGCFYSSGSIIPSSAIANPFPASGSATFKSEPDEDEPNPQLINVTFQSTGNGYRVISGDGKTSTSYELGDLGNGWLVVGELSRTNDQREYGLVQVSGNTLKVYNTDCSMLTNSERNSLGLTMSEDDECQVASWDQLRQAMIKIIDEKPLKLSRTYTVH